MKILKFLLLLYFFSFLHISCGDSSEDESKALAGTRYKVIMVRAIDAKDWVKTTGTQEWWFFNGDVFRQIGSDYVEPQFYGPSQACNGSGSGVYQINKTEDRKLDVTLTYDGINDVSGLCRMTDRTLNITLQPSEVVDVVDHVRVQRLERMEKLY